MLKNWANLSSFSFDVHDDPSSVRPQDLVREINGQLEKRMDYGLRIGTETVYLILSGGVE